MKTFLLLFFVILFSIQIYPQINPDEFPKIGYFDMYAVKRAAYYNNNQIDYSDSSWFYPALTELGLSHGVTTHLSNSLPLSNKPPYDDNFNSNIKIIDNIFARASTWTFNKPYKYSHSAVNYIDHFPYEAGGQNIALLTSEPDKFGFGNATTTSWWIYPYNNECIPHGDLAKEDLPLYPGTIVHYAQVNSGPPGIILKAKPDDFHLPYFQKWGHPFYYKLSVRARIDGAPGNVKRVFGCVGWHRQPLLVDNSGNIYFAPGCDSLASVISIDSTGQLRWEYIVNNGDATFNDSSPAIDYDGNIYYAYTITTSTPWYGRIESVDYYGNHRWTYQFEQPDEWIWMPLIVDKEGTVYCGSTWGYYFYAISSEGELLWKIPLNGYQVDNSGAIDSNGTLYIGTHLSSLTTGQEKTLIAIRDTVTSVEDENTSISSFKLEQNYPNPFNSATNIKYSIPQSSRVVIKIFDIIGKEVATLLDRYQESGSYDIIFRPDNLASGIYFYQLQVGEFRATKKLILLK